MITLRLNLLYYSMLNYPKALDEFKSFLYLKNNLKYQINSKIQDRLIELAAYSLFELKSSSSFLDFVGDKLSSKILHRVIISSLNISKKFGDIQFIEKVSQNLEPYYLESPYYIDFLNFQMSLYKKGAINYFFVLNKGLQSLQWGSYWQVNFSSDSSLNEKRRTFLLLNSRGVLENLLKSNIK